MKLTTEQSKWNLIKIVTLLAFIGICYKFYTIVRFSYSDVQWRGRYDLLTFLMPIVCLGVFIDIIRQKTLRGFFAISFVYISYAVFITIASCGYPLFNLPFAIVNMTYWYVVCYAFYRFFKNYDQTKKMDWLIKLTLVLFYICAVAYFISLGEANELAYYEKRDVLANTSYYLICLFPIVLLTPSKTIRVITTILLSVIVVFSNKRAGFIVMAVCLACVFFIDSSSKKNNAKYLRFIILAIVTVFLTFFILFSLLRPAHGLA